MKVYFQNSSKLSIKFSILFWQLLFGTLPFTLIISMLAYTGQKPTDFNCFCRNYTVMDDTVHW
ncbi:hypothetical protein D3C87_271910 [compost metagenome]